MQFLQEFIHHLLSENRNVIAVSAHIEITTAKSIEACPGRSLLFRKRYWEKTSSSLLVMSVPVRSSLYLDLSPRWCMALDCAVRFSFDLMCLVCNDKVGIKGKQFFLQSPCRFIIDNSDLQTIPMQLGKPFFFSVYCCLSEQSADMEKQQNVQIPVPRQRE